jgi:predicted ribosomally synthesized peptide with SipW-like signal peptide
MKKIIFSLSIVAVVAAVAVGATTAFFSDTETSTGNTFTAGSIDLKVDSECHYWLYDPSHPDAVVGGDMDGYWDQGCDGWGDWEETDLEDGVHKFVHVTDLKPGDWGENTISLHVYDNDAWGVWNWLMFDNDENGCTEPEEDDDLSCGNPGEGEGELLTSMEFDMWLDQGSIPGFQNGAPGAGEVEGPSLDLEEGDNIWQDGEPEISLAPGMPLWPVLSSAWSTAGCSDVDGDTDYTHCHGLAEDGRMVGSTTYYFGFMWHLPEEVGNEAQTDSLGGNMEFKVVQHRNNPDKDGLGI